VAGPVTPPSPGARRPWWIPPFLGRIPDVEPRLMSMLGLVSLALLFESYDVSMLTSALKFIREDLEIKDRELPFFLSAVRLGAVPAFLLVIPFADRIGRRKMFLASVVGISVCTGATGLVETPAQFVIMQTLGRAFLVAGSAIAIVIVTEEFPAEHRGWAIGMVGALSATGHGFGAILFAFYDWLPGGWRTLYALGAAPLLLLPTFRRGVVETKRFVDHAATASVTGWHGPLVSLAREYPTRATLVAVVSMLLGIGTVSVFQFTGDYVLTVHGWEPGHFSLMLLTAGGIGIIGNIVAGRLGDRIGRRRVGAAFFSFFPLFAIVFYTGPSWVLPIAYAGIVFSQTAGAVMLRATSTELFPTSHRGTAAGWATMAETLGWAIGLALVGLGTTDLGDIPGMTSLVSLSVLAAGITMLWLPETARQELEAISPEHWPGDDAR